MTTLLAMKKIGKAIKTLDGLSIINEECIGGKENVKILDETRANLIRTLFLNGCELQPSYKVVKSNQK